MTIEEIVDKHWDAMFDDLIDAPACGDNLWELIIEVKTQTDGKTVRKSWRDREDRLK